MGFQDNVRATNNKSQFGTRKGATIIALSVTFLISVSLGTLSNPGLAYAIFLTGAVVAAMQHPRYDSIKKDPAITLRAAVRPIAQSLGLGLIAMTILVLGFGWANAQSNLNKRLSDLFLYSVMAAYVEEAVRWLWLQTLPYSVVTANVLWVSMHPQVGKLFRGEAPDLFFAVFALLFGFLMTAVMWLYERPLPRNFNKGLGPLAAATFHGVYNAMVVLFVVVVGATTFGTFSIAGLVIMAAVVALLWATRRAGGLKLLLARSGRRVISRPSL